MPLDETVQLNDAGHTAAHAELRTAYMARGNASLPVFTGYGSTHNAIHNALHAEHNALGGATLPAAVGAAGHLAHHSTLAAAHNARDLQAAILAQATWRWAASSITSLTSGSPVTTIQGRGTSTVALTQATSTKRPTWLASGIGGKPALQFDGADDALTSAATISRGATGTWVVVHRPNITGYGQLAYLPQQEIYWDGTNYGIYGNAGVSTSALVSRVPQVWTGVFDGATSTLRTNGTIVGSGNSGTGSAGAATLTIGSHETLGRYYPGMVAEILGWDRALTGAELAQVHSYIQDTYGIAVTDYAGANPLPGPGAILFEDDFTGPAGTYNHNKWGEWSYATFNGGAAYGNIMAGDRATLNGSGQLVIPATPTEGTCISTKDDFTFTYGTFTARMMIPTQAGYWPAFWTLNGPPDGSSTALGGEIDAIEAYTQYNDGYRIGAHNYVNGVDVGPAMGNPLIGGGDIRGQWHDYGARIEPDKVTFLFDGAEVFSFTPDYAGLQGQPWAWGPNAQNWMLLTLAIGGAGQAAPTQNAQLLVDRVEVRAL